MLYKVWEYKSAVLIFGAIFLIAYFLGGTESAADKAERIRTEIEVIKEHNISVAQEELSTLDVKRADLLAQLSDVDTQMFLYQKCIDENNIQELPVSCSDITLNLKEVLGWKVNNDGLSQEYLDLVGDTPKQRASYLLRHYPAVNGMTDFFIEMGQKYNVNPYLVIAIAKADSGLGNQLKSANNIGNVGNNDAGDVVAFANIHSGIEAIFQTLNNQYLGEIYSVGYLSCGGKYELGIKDCFQNGEKVYATSGWDKEKGETTIGSWNVNVINTMRNIYNDPTIDATYNFRK